MDNLNDIFGGDSSLTKLIDELEEMFPPTTHTPKDQLTEIMYRSGQRSVVDYIKTKLEKD